VDGQRDVVKNERRQSYENRPYGMASLELDRMLWPANHPYSWPVIGHMEDLTAASHEDVVEFFKKYYAPNNASLVIAGDIDFARTRALVEKWFGEIPRGTFVDPIAPPAAVLTEVKRQTLTDNVALTRLHIAWLTPRLHAPGDAALDLASSVLAGGKNSRLYKRLVYDTQMAQDVSAFQQSGALGSSFLITATARRGRTAAEMQAAIDEEIERLRRDPPDAREVQRAVNQVEASFYRRMESVGGFGGKADQLNAYYFAGGIPDYFAEDLARYTSLSPADVQAAIVRWLPAGRRVELVVEPEKKQ
jgi:zinc protease